MVAMDDVNIAHVAMKGEVEVGRLSVIKDDCISGKSNLNARKDAVEVKFL